MRIIRGWTVATLGVGLLVGCKWVSEPLPTCSDESTLDMVRRILAEQASGASVSVSETVLRKRLTFRYPRATSLQENIKKYTCEVELVVVGDDGAHEMRLGYETQLDDAGDHLVSVEGIALPDAAIIRAALTSGPSAADRPVVAAESAPPRDDPDAAETAVAETAEDPQSLAATTPESIETERAAVQDGTAASADYPRFRDYPVEDLYTGPAAPLDMSGETARTFRTRLRDALAEGRIVAAGEYVAAGWGCGAGCFYATFVNKRTGRVVEDGIGGEGGQRIVGADPHSRLVIAEGPEYDDAYDPTGYFAYFYELVDGRLVQIRKTPVPRDPNE